MWRRSRAVQLATAGYSYDAIAREVGYANRGTAWRAVDKALRDQLADDVEMYRQIEMDRLDSLYLALWPHVEAGDMKAFTAALRTIALRVKLLGLDRVPKDASVGYSIVQPDHPAFHTKVEGDVLDVPEALAG